MSDILPIIDKLWINLNLLFNMVIYRYQKEGLHIIKESAAFNIGDIVFQVFSLLFIALIVTIIVIAIRMIRRKQVELKKVEARLNKVIEKNHLKE
ncbi:hypothetical protein [Bacillus sp. FSL M8-0077]|uniref:hypothetical protein n=1 Tax=Bacillus sp. FSL M8-0077 TaxID=2954556 RepID=UPI0030FD6A34